VRSASLAPRIARRIASVDREPARRFEQYARVVLKLIDARGEGSA
jgi:hypothetical protein